MWDSHFVCVCVTQKPKWDLIAMNPIIIFHSSSGVMASKFEKGTNAPSDEDRAKKTKPPTARHRMVSVPRASVPRAFLESPFLDFESTWLPKELAMNAIMLPLLPLRILIMVIGLAAWAILARVAVIGLDLRQDEDVFLTGWRFRVSQLSGAPCWLVLFGLGFYGVKVRGYDENYRTLRRRVGEDGVIGVFNHMSYVDALILMALFTPSGVSRKENRDLLVVGPGLRAFDPIYVDVEGRRGGSRNAAAAEGPSENEAASRRIKERVRGENYMRNEVHGNGNPPRLLFIAPEGTTHNGNAVLPFRRGAFAAGLPVLPVVLHYRCHRNRLNGNECGAVSYFSPSWWYVHSEGNTHTRAYSSSLCAPRSPIRKLCHVRGPQGSRNLGAAF